MSFSPETLLSAVYFGTIAVVALLEPALPRRASAHSVLVRWPNNFAIGWLNVVLEGWVLGLAGVTTSLYAEGHHGGLLARLDLPELPLALGCVLFLDLLAYWIHRALHAFGPLWRLHAVHHSDLDLDFSTSFRRHPLEVLAVALVLVPTILVLGVPPLAVFLFLVLRAAVLVLEHANLRLRVRLDRVLRRVIVTPDVHRVHHSAWQPETDSNFGDLFTWWDRLFGTFREQPRVGHEAMAVGLDSYRDTRFLWLPGMIWQPLAAVRRGSTPERLASSPGRADEGGGA